LWIFYGYFLRFFSFGSFYSISRTAAVCIFHFYFFCAAPKTNPCEFCVLQLWYSVTDISWRNENMVEVAAALIWDGDRFMICQRPRGKARAMLWEFVGGKVEPGETKRQALIRECHEEIGVTLSVGTVFDEVSYRYPDIDIHMTLFNAEIADGTPQKLEHNDIKWIKTDEISGYDFCPADTTILAKLKHKKP